MKENTEYLPYNEPEEIPNTKFEIEILDAGHIPGSGQIIVDDGDKRLLYTGDINTYETRLQRPANTYYRDIDIVIIESTYADEVHPKRDKMEGAFVEKIKEVVDDGGIALVPAFALGRSQEILLILHHHGYKGRLSIDGMAVTATEILLRHKNYLKSYKSLKKAFNKAKKIRKWRDRKKVVKEPGVIIAPAGMLGGGSAVFYMNKVYENEKNGIFLVGYQAPGTPGKTLLEEKIMDRGGTKKKVKSQVYYFQFSSHTDQKGLDSIIRNLDGDAKVMVVHGEDSSRKALKRLCKEKYGIDVILPSMGDEYEFD
jgi:putative mRNA 3-end processing factor